MSENIIEVSDSTFTSTVIESDLPILVDFWAPWCGPCKAIAPVLEEVAKEYSGRLRVAKVNVDENQTYASSYNVQSIPNLIIFKGGKVVDRLLGYASKEQLTAVIDKAI